MKSLRSFSENKLFLKFLAIVILGVEILNKLEVSKLFNFDWIAILPISL